MWDIDVIATGRHNDLLRRAAERRLAARTKATAELESAHRSARRVLGFALVHAGLWILVGGGRDVRDERFEQLARDPELETARASTPQRS